MFFPFHETKRESRRACLKWMGAAALLPLIAKAGCPCGGDDNAAAIPAAASVSPPATQPESSLRICADPNNLPFSNRNREGFEDKIAALTAQDLGRTLEYDWLPQRLGFYRTAFKTYESNLVMAAPAGFQKALVTDPYYRSSYVFVYRKASEPPKTLDDKLLSTMKIGVQLTGGDTPATHALAKRKLINNVTGYPVFDETEGKPAENIVRAVADSQIDVAIVWGPQAGYFVKQHATLAMAPITPDHDGDGPAEMPFTFQICMAVKRSDETLRGQINASILKRQKEIDQILADFSVPTLPIKSDQKTAGAKA